MAIETPYNSGTPRWMACVTSSETAIPAIDFRNPVVPHSGTACPKMQITAQSNAVTMAVASHPVVSATSQVAVGQRLSANRQQVGSCFSTNVLDVVRI